MNRGVYLLVIHGTTPIVHRRHDSPALADVTVARRRALVSSRLVSFRLVRLVRVVFVVSRASSRASRWFEPRLSRDGVDPRARDMEPFARSPTSMMIRELAAEVLATPDGGEARKTRARESDEDDAVEPGG